MPPDGAAGGGVTASARTTSTGAWWPVGLAGCDSCTPAGGRDVVFGCAGVAFTGGTLPGAAPAAGGITLTLFASSAGVIGTAGNNNSSSGLSDEGFVGRPAAKSLPGLAP